MDDIPAFVHAIGWWWVVLMSGIASVIMAIYEKVFGGKIGRAFFVVVGIICVFMAFYFSWDEQYQKQLNAESKSNSDERLLRLMQEDINRLKSPNESAKAVMALQMEVKAFDKALTHAGDRYDPQLDSYDLRQKWGPKIDEYGDKLLGYGASKEQLDKLIRQPPPYANDPKMGEYYKKIAVELDKMADSLVVPQ
jgi:hypothetical protein